MTAIEAININYFNCFNHLLIFFGNRYKPQNKVFADFF